MARYEIPMPIVERDGPFSEFKQDGAVVSVELADGTTFDGVLLIYPNEVWAIRGRDRMPFDPAHVVRAFQTEKDLESRTDSTWILFGAGNAT